MEQSAQAALLHFSSSGNPSSIHSFGRQAKVAVDQGREQLAAALGVQDPEELCFTGSATESINFALKGLYFHSQQAGQRFHLITSAVEHEATLETAHFLQTLGIELTILPVDRHGRLDLTQLQETLAQRKGEAVLVSLLAANNETGVVFPWQEAAALTKAAGAYFHLDGVQALGKLAGFSLGNAVDLASFSAHKIGGPKGVGVLYIRRGTKLLNLLHGGAQERKRRAGTLNVAGIAAFGAAAAALGQEKIAQTDRLRLLLEGEVRKIPGTQLQGEAAPRLANTSNFLFDGVRGEALVMGLDIEGFAVSSGSACNSGSILPSHVLLAMGLDKLAARSALRISLSSQNTEGEVRAFCAALERVVARIRSLS